MADKPTITITENGPYVVKGAVPLSEDAVVPAPEGHHLQYNRIRDFETKEEQHLCRCGASAHKPFCDGSHKKIDFDGTEVASKAPYDVRAQVYEGEAVELLDDNRCAYARLCHRKHGEVWTLTEEATGGELAEEAVAAAWHCPTGRLESHHADTGEIIEQEFDPSIIVLEDPQNACSGPIFVRGGIELIGADGTAYEQRNRYALCRCGNSKNKPFCDALHVPTQFTDDSPALQGEMGKRDETFVEKPPL